MPAIRRRRTHWSLLAVVVCLSLGASVAWSQHAQPGQQSDLPQQVTPKDQQPSNENIGPQFGPPAPRQVVVNQQAGRSDESGAQKSSSESLIERAPDWSVALFTLALVFVTRGLWKSTEKLWKASDDQMKLNEANAKRELRAYLTVIPDGINQLIGRPDVIGHVLLRNVGKLPARNVSLLVTMERSKHPEPEPSFRTQKFDLPRVVTNADRVIQPGGEMRQGSEKPYIPISALTFPDYNVYVYGIVRYDDGYGRQCFTKFCHRYATASRNRSVKGDSRPTKSRTFISADKARYHNYGNSAEPPFEQLDHSG